MKQKKTNTLPFQKQLKPQSHYNVPIFEPKPKEAVLLKKVNIKKER
jgi:hypothetical protein